ncbi:hypothetical protein [Nonomuraea rhodomycinica]|uniref:Uncharacterized protein n=1 Tax=Nonomuraea rhodomycinica TaxID=1712872 RepID=A0A7Y6MD59_9ACTN|nr:hypothetical protein [Nonomuraea rhodomycinica]NUW43517.1 hypothetical protein [Nonomuraea rhodomycinica]
MVVIGFTLLGVGLGVALLLALADPVLLSRINGEHAEGGSGRHIEVPREEARVLRLAKRDRDDRHEPAAA